MHIELLASAVAPTYNFNLALHFHTESEAAQGETYVWQRRVRAGCVAEPQVPDAGLSAAATPTPGRDMTEQEASQGNRKLLLETPPKGGRSAIDTGAPVPPRHLVAVVQVGWWGLLIRNSNMHYSP